MELDRETGLFSDVIFLPSPNYNERPPETEIDLLVIHNISLPPGQFGEQYVPQFFMNELDSAIDPYFEEISDLKVSSHLYISREGEIWQFVPLTSRAWHAGVSCFEGRENCNDFSIGIELEGTDDIPFTSSQYDSLIQITQILMDNYPLMTLDHIVGHCDIAPDRKTDPGPLFDWSYYRSQINQIHECHVDNLST